MAPATEPAAPAAAAGNPGKRGASRPFPIIAIGASAGGLEALEQFLGRVPDGSGMAFVVIQHLDPNYKGMMPELLQRATTMPVQQAKNLLKVRPDNVYVIPPSWDLSIVHDMLYLLEPVATRGLRLPVDFFFRALAIDRGANAVGVILSGMGSDGALGLRAIKESGGLVVAQGPSDAKFSGMPQSAIDTGLVDIVATAAELPLRIHAYLRYAPVGPRSTLYALETPAQKSAFGKICILLRERTGNDFTLYKRSTVYRRVERRMGLHQIDRIAHYAQYLRENPQEVDLLFKELLIGVTSFFRDPAAWVTLQEKVLPALLGACSPGATLRAWVAGCSTGEEAYTLAMVFREVQQNLRPGGRETLQIFATDIDADAIAKARRGVYPANIVADVSPERLKRFFVDEGGGFRVGKQIRETIVFAPQNIVMDPPFTNLDIVTCRNLLIYLSADLQKRILPLLHYSLMPGGVLMLGGAESVGNYTELFETVNGPARIFRRHNASLSTSELEFPSRKLPKGVATSDPAIVEPQRGNLQTLADQVLLRNYSPAAVLVTATGDVLYTNGRTGKYLEPAAGKANWNIHVMAKEGLRDKIALAMPRALRGDKPVVFRQLKVGSEGDARIIDLSVQVLDKPTALRGTVLLVFADVGAAPEEAAARAAAPRRSRRIMVLEEALEHGREEVQALHEEMQTTQEELKSSNEEMQSTNEELQSTNEELTTSKEEMQSLNEELQTVNVELQLKVDDLSLASNDMENLLNSTDMATVFLDGALQLRRFTNQATRIFRLLPGDVGRPLSDITFDLDYSSLSSDVEEVLRTLVFCEREVEASNGRWFQIKIMPYRTMDNVIDGVVITFNDISRAKILEARLRGNVTRAGETP